MIDETTVELAADRPTDPRELFRIELRSMLPDIGYNLQPDENEGADLTMAGGIGEPEEVGYDREYGYAPDAIVTWALEQFDTTVRNLAVVLTGSPNVADAMQARADGDSALAELGTASGLIAAYSESMAYLDAASKVLRRGVSIRDANDLANTFQGERERLRQEIVGLYTKYPALQQMVKDDAEYSKRLVIPGR